MSSSSNEGHLSPISAITAINDIPKPHNGKQSADIVDWDGPQDPDNPRKSVHIKLSQNLGTEPILSLCSWPLRRKWAASLVVSAFPFISHVSSTMVAPATFQATSDLGVTSNVVTAMMTSIFILGYGQLYHIVST